MSRPLTFLQIKKLQLDTCFTRLFVEQRNLTKASSIIMQDSVKTRYAQFYKHRKIYNSQKYLDTFNISCS